MKSFIIAQDDQKNPKRSILLVGTEVPDDEVRAAFFQHKAAGFHPDEWAVLRYYGPSGFEGASVARFKNAKEKAAALAKEQSDSKRPEKEKEKQ